MFISYRKNVTNQPIGCKNENKSASKSTKVHRKDRQSVHTCNSPRQRRRRETKFGISQLLPPPHSRARLGRLHKNCSNYLWKYIWERTQRILLEEQERGLEERNCDRDTKLDGRVAFRKRGRQSRVKTVLASWRLNLQKIAKMSIKQVAKNKKG